MRAVGKKKRSEYPFLFLLKYMEINAAWSRSVPWGRSWALESLLSTWWLVLTAHMRHQLGRRPKQVNAGQIRPTQMTSPQDDSSPGAETTQKMNWKRELERIETPANAIIYFSWLRTCHFSPCHSAVSTADEIYMSSHECPIILAQDWYVPTALNMLCSHQRSVLAWEAILLLPFVKSEGQRDCGLSGLLCASVQPGSVNRPNVRPGTDAAPAGSDFLCHWAGIRWIAPSPPQKKEHGVHYYAVETVVFYSLTDVKKAKGGVFTVCVHTNIHLCHLSFPP